MSNEKVVLVTGAAGFIGSHLTDQLLKQGHTVVGIDNLSRGTRENIKGALEQPSFHFFDADLADLTAFKMSYGILI